VRWPPAYENVSPGTEERPLMEDVAKQCSSVKTVTDNTSLCVTMLSKV
jgi:hypothetical protein